MMNETVEPKIFEIVQQVKAEIANLLDEKFEKIVLFGSYARGDYANYSDIDLMLVVKNMLSKNEKNSIVEILSKFSLEYDVVLSCIDYPTAMVEKYQTPFLLNIMEEGIKI